MCYDWDNRFERSQYREHERVSDVQLGLRNAYDSRQEMKAVFVNL